jgi:ATP-dependent Clp protease ATP-binding subunit ClpA
LLREGDGVAARLFKSLDVDLDMTRQEILKELDPNSQAEDRTSKSEEPISKEEELRSKSEEAIHEAEEPILNLNQHAQQALALARKEADRFNHNFVGTEHLLLGVVRVGEGTAVRVLQKMGIDLGRVQSEVKKKIGSGPPCKHIGVIPYTPRVKRIISLALNEAKALGHSYLGTEHLLLGMLSEGDGVAARVLKDFGVELERTCQEIRKELDPNKT